MKSVFKTILVMTLLLSVTSQVYAEETNTEDEVVRINITSPRKSNTEVSLKGSEGIRVNKEDEELFELNESINIKIENNKSYIKIQDMTFENYKEAEEEMNKIEEQIQLDMFIYYNGEQYELYGENIEEVEDILINNDIAVEVVDKTSNIKVEDSKGNIVIMYEEDNLLFTSYNEGIEADTIKIDGKEYRGKVGILVTDGKILTINNVDVESYLKGVVANEMPYTWEKEALKAQAVAARTYAIACIKPTATYDMVDTTGSQVYGGLATERETTSEAIDYTRGEELYYAGKLITAYYHSTSGGRTENSENVWSAVVPYLKGVEDEYSNDSPHTSWTLELTKETLLNKVKNTNNKVKDIYDFKITKVSENGRVLECIIDTNVGELVYKKEQIRALLGYSVLKSTYFSIVSDRKVDSASISNYLSENEKSNLVLISEGDNLTAVKTIFGSSMIFGTGKITDVSASVVLLSKCGEKITVSAIKDTLDEIIDEELIEQVKAEKEKPVVTKPIVKPVTSEQPSDYYIVGRGWGHGIGMSQWGAKGMAQEGFTYDEILQHYYTGVEIE